MKHKALPVTELYQNRDREQKLSLAHLRFSGIVPSWEQFD
jgi:hypothetical protein